MTAVVQRLMTTATSLAMWHTGTEIDRAAVSLLQSVIDADEVLLTRVDLVGPSTCVRCGADLEVDADLEQGLARVGHLHPAVMSYTEIGDDRRPRRVSDVTSGRAWRSSIVYNELFRQRPARHQLSLVTQLADGCGTGWVLTRSGRDFTDDDVATAELVLPLLTAMAELAVARGGPAADGLASLTPREYAVLRLLATGRSARQIARDLGMSEGTTRKHLSHIYSKLGVHDRLSAVLCLDPRPDLRPNQPPDQSSGHRREQRWFVT